MSHFVYIGIGTQPATLQISLVKELKEFPVKPVKET